MFISCVLLVIIFSSVGCGVGAERLQLKLVKMRKEKRHFLSACCYYSLEW